MLQMKFVTFNLRYSYDGDGVNSFVHRLGLILSVLQREAPDVLCFQEATPRILSLLSPALGAYSVFFSGRDAHMSGEGLSLALRRDTVELLTLDRFWLSPAPAVPGSCFPHQSPNLCAYGARAVRSDAGHSRHLPQFRAQFRQNRPYFRQSGAHRREHLLLDG